MLSRKELSSPNVTDCEIPVQFVVLHYTGTTLRRTLELLMDPARKASAHLVIDSDGSVYELVPCLDAPAKRAWHAGDSRIDFDGSLMTTLNDCSVGIELVNLNGNVFNYTDAQYRSLSECLSALSLRYPLLQDRRRVLGHETIAGFRGKCDPGLRFDWARIGVNRHAGGCAPDLATRLGDVYKALAPAAFMDARGGGLTAVSVPSEVPETVYEALSALTEQAHMTGQRKGSPPT